jgi:hypothetical protein
MLARRERLLSLLGAVFAASILALLITFGLERLKEVQARAQHSHAQIAKLRGSLRPESDIVSRRDSLKGKIEAARKGFYSQGEIDPYTFGTRIKKKLTAHGLKVIRYQVLVLKGSISIEFSVSGSTSSFILFLKEVSESDRYWSVPSLALSMQGESGVMDSVFRIGYEVLDF